MPRIKNAIKKMIRSGTGGAKLLEANAKLRIVAPRANKSTPKTSLKVRALGEEFDKS